MAQWVASPCIVPKRETAFSAHSANQGDIFLVDWERFTLVETVLVDGATVLTEKRTLKQELAAHRATGALALSAGSSSPDVGPSRFNKPETPYFRQALVYKCGFAVSVTYGLSLADTGRWAGDPDPARNYYVYWGDCVKTFRENAKADSGFLYPQGLVLRGACRRIPCVCLRDCAADRPGDTLP
jgi:hypothetical protein